MAGNGPDLGGTPRLLKAARLGRAGQETPPIQPGDLGVSVTVDVLFAIE
jgi:uncharacterized protein YggE